MTAAPAQLAAAKYVSLTTFKRDGTAVATPVWIAGDGDGLAVVTEARSWKVKRLRNDARVELAVSDARGRVKGDAVRYRGTAEVVTGQALDRVRSLIDRKYGLPARLMPSFYAVRSFLLRRPAPEAVGLSITLHEPGEADAGPRITGRG